ncbi:hypothetical protein SAMN05443287_10342 [Micromonospora phaseoli]|uniref:Uncharacterized protein n=1 Tax=Micromonospora phaseoli TaxID=1144548 RepID=A0A1H6WII2_9ACTN|nr:hypothetical protein [Micromonospora phaseoli]PZW01676.1 hypothetical protein CLV64_10242 [Micromonospora phaseoli]GIJ80703.1 hypothetical protein Xph01_51350 [Micromonospora phaseoli]SEJ12620.1 hypothetical protein SAMN05443287_10342 [Micromonospora phaseoli]
MAPIVRIALTGCGVAAGAAGNLLAIGALPWANYGALEQPLDRFPGWFWHVAAVAVLYTVAGWTLLSPPARRRAPIVISGLAGLAAAGSAVALAVRYDDASLFFDTFVPAVNPVLGTGAVLAVLSVLVCLAAVGSCWPRSSGAPAPARPGAPT